MDYDWLCSSGHNDFEISPNDFDLLLESGSVSVIDVREFGELPIPPGFNYTQIPLSQFKENINTITSDPIILFCQSGKRSRQAAELLLNKYGSTKKIYSLEGGIINWLKNNPSQQS